MIVVVLTLILLVIIVAVVISRGQKAQEPETAAKLPYDKNEALFTPAERSFLGVLDQATGTQYRVFGKVRLADIVGVTETDDRGARQSAMNKIDRKHFDFVLCDPATLAVLCAIELDDGSHRRQSRQDRDALVDEVCRAAALPLIRVPAQRTYSVVELRALLDKAIGRPAIEVNNNPA